MSDKLSDNALTVLSSTVVADVQTDAPTLHTFYTCPVGKRLIVDALVIRDATADLDGMADCDFGGGADAASPAWIDNETGIGDIMSDVGIYMTLRNDDASKVIIDGDDLTIVNRSFGMLITAGSTGAAGATFDLIGYLIDS